MTEQIKYQSSNIDVYCYEDKMINMGSDFHIIVDTGNEYYVDIVSFNGFNIINRRQLKDGLVRIPFLDFVNTYNSICEKCNKHENIQEIKSSYTKEELMMINSTMGSLLNWSRKDNMDYEEKGTCLKKVR